jgi:hypothetical protein
MKNTCKIFSITARIYILLLILTFSYEWSFLQAQSISWQRLYHPRQNGAEDGYGICGADGSNSYIVGFTALPFSKGYVIKISATGDTIWSRVIDTLQSLNCVAKTLDDGCVVGGYANTGILCKIDKYGVIQWTCYLPQSSQIRSILRLASGDILACGISASGSANVAYLTKVNVQGNVLWARTFVSGNSLELYSVDTAINGGFIVAGTTTEGQYNLFKCYLAKLNDTGNIAWQKSFSFSNGITLGACVVNNNSNYLLSGITSNSGYISKVSTLGDTLKLSIFYGSSQIYKVTFAKYNSNKFLIVRNYGNFDIFQNLDSNLVILRQLQLTANANYTLAIYSTFVTSSLLSQDIISVGTSDLNSLGDLDVYAVRIDSSLTMPPPIGIIQQTENSFQDCGFLQNHPNPFNSTTQFEFVLNKSGKVAIKVIDVLGKYCAGFDLGLRNPGRYEISENLSNLASGIYFTQLVIDSRIVSTIKILLIK